MGENWAIRSSRGSPPRVRGKGRGKPKLVLTVRITPARAGKSARLARNWEISWDHPRACGEKRTRSFA